MAIYHLHVSTGSRAKGQSAAAKAQYILRQGRYKKNSDEMLFSMSSNMPAWAAASPLEYWRAADDFERANGVLFREVELALPVELNLPQKIQLAKKFAAETAEGQMPYTMGLHRGKEHNPHLHLVMSERYNDGHRRTPETWFRRAASAGNSPESGGARKSDISSRRKTWLEQIRFMWAHMANEALAAAGFSARIDHRTLAEQGEDRLPQIHMGPNIVEMEQKGLPTDRADQALEIAEANRQLAELQQIEKEIQNEQRTRPRDPRPQPAGSRRVAAATSGNKPATRSSAKSGSSHGQSPQAPPTTAPAASSKKSTRPASRPVSQPQEGDPDMMNLSPAEQQEFLRVRRQLAAQQQAETKEARQRQLSEEQKHRFLELEALAAEAEHTRKDHRYLDHDFAWGCLCDLRQQRQTVETADWRKTESKVAEKMLQNGANLEDVAGLLYDLGLSATTGTPVAASALQHLQNLALSSPDLAEAMRYAEQREKEEKRRPADEDHREKHSAPKLPGA